ncbi:MAG: Xylulose kinase [Planctomycetota bacterium]|jgi:xylulokinase
MSPSPAPGASSDALFLGIDIGTSGTKCVVIDAAGALVADATVEHPVSYPKPGWAEQDPEHWWKSTVAAVRQACGTAAGIASRIEAIGLSGQMHGLVTVDAGGEVVRPCILWNDSRSTEICEALHEREPGLATVLRTTGNRVFPGFQAPKLLWMREHEPAAFARTAKALLPKDWLRYRLSGAYMAEPSDASGTAVFDCARRDWSDEMLAITRLPRALFPDVAESPVHSTRLSEGAARELGLRAGIGIAGGAGDQAAAAIGSGIASEGTVSCNIGTSGVVFAASNRWRATPNGELHAFCHAVPDRWHFMGVMLSAGGSLRWFRDTLAQDAVAEARARGVDAYEILAERASTVAIGSDGLTFLPYLSGERCPIPDPRIRGGFAGLDVSHGAPHLSRAVFEGITAGLAANLDLMRELGVGIHEVRLSGGGSRSAFWRSMCADMFESRVSLLASEASGAFGVALLAAVGAGAFASVDEACAATVRTRDAIEPDAARRTAYRAVKARMLAASAHALRIDG